MGYRLHEMPPMLGLTPVRIRDIAREIGRVSAVSERFFTDAGRRGVGLGAALGAEVFRGFLDKGWIEVDPDWPSDHCGTRYALTDEGRRLALSNATRPIPLARAEAVLDVFLDRCEEVRRSDDFVCDVKRVFLFGSVLRGAPEVGDIDLVVEYGRKEHLLDLDRESRDAILEEYRERHSTGNEDHRAWLAIPGRVMLRHIVGGRKHPALSLHDHHDVQGLGCACRLVFEVERGRVADAPVAPLGADDWFDLRRRAREEVGVSASPPRP